MKRYGKQGGFCLPLPRCEHLDTLVQAAGFYEFKKTVRVPIRWWLTCPGEMNPSRLIGNDGTAERLPEWGDECDEWGDVEAVAFGPLFEIVCAELGASIRP